MGSPYSSSLPLEDTTVGANDDPVLRHGVSAPVSLSTEEASCTLPELDYELLDLIWSPPSSNITPNVTFYPSSSLDSPSSSEDGSNRRKLNEMSHRVGTLLRQMVSLPPPAPSPSHPTNANRAGNRICVDPQVQQQGSHGFKKVPKSSSLTSQLSLDGETRDDIHPQISEIPERMIFNIPFDNIRSQYDTHSFDVGDQESYNVISFSAQPNKRSKSSNKDQMELQKAIDILSSVEKQHKSQDLFNFKIRAKNGCTTDPRCIAERERRHRIYRNLKKLQDLVPNLDKQSSYAEMLDLAAEHIKNLQDQVQKLRKVNKMCKCGRNEEKNVKDG